MSNVGVFVAGAMVTLIVSAALFLVIWGALMDGKDEKLTPVPVKAPAKDPRVMAVASQDDASVISAPLGRRRIGMLGQD